MAAKETPNDDAARALSVAIDQVARARQFHADGFAPVEHLEVVASLRSAMSEAVKTAIGAAKETGMSWTEIANVLGVTQFEARALYEQS